VRVGGALLIVAVVGLTAVVALAQPRDIAPHGPAFRPSHAHAYAESWAVIIGINEYQHGRVPKLRYAVSDAQAVERELLAHGFRSDRIITLLDRQATKAAIERVLGDDLRARMTKDDRILVFFAGHGKTDRLRSGEEEGYLIPVDGDPSRLFSTAISMQALRQISDRLPAKHILYVVDACYSGYALFNRAISDDLLEEMVKKPAIQILTAGRQEDQAQERAGHGVFTQIFLQGLQGEAFGGKSWLALEELGLWVKSRVFAESNRRQLPQFGNLSGQGQFVFLRPASQVAKEEPASEPQRPKITEEPRGDRGTLAVRADLAGIEVWVGPERVGEINPRRLLLISDLPAGTHRVRARKPGYRDREFEVQVARGKQTDLAIELEPLTPPNPITPAGDPKLAAALPPPPPPAGVRMESRGRDQASMVFIPEGSFFMGAPDDDPHASAAEKPQRSIVVSGFWIDRLEVTNIKYAQFREAGRHRSPLYARDLRFNAPDQPIIGVTWEDAREYCRWAGKRLPTEAEWEKAARGTDGRRFPWGSVASEDLVHVMKSKTSDVGQYAGGASPYGVLDMAGNVWEWVQDWWAPATYRKDTLLVNPTGPSMGGEKVLRGGSWFERDVTATRSTMRHHQAPDRANNNVGFRCSQ
jgi:formylglycine-generating enzyme required for sulfatase activity/uncharacterized caspase-like protein